MNNLIGLLETYRLKNRLSQGELAKRLKVVYPTVNRWFNKKTSPNKINCYHIKKLLDI